jgi:pimeloyl-ACP methyl ester carboxylesterase
MSEAVTAVPRPRQLYTEPERIDVAGLEVAYRRKGQGEPALLLHGAGFTRQWLPFYERLSAAVDLICPEHPGYGETPMPDWLDGLGDLIIHYDQLLDALELETVHLLGYSLGGWIAAEYAAVYPRRLRSLTLITPVGLRIEEPMAPIFGMAPEELFGTLFNDPTNIGQVAPDPASLDEIVHGYAEATTLAGLAWARPYDLKLARRLARVQCPALVLGAEADRLVPNAMAKRYAEALRDSRFVTIPGTGHALIIEQPEATAVAIADFLAGPSA